MLLDQSYELVPVGKLEQHPDNPRQGNTEVISESVSANGFYGAIVAQRSTGYVLAGNHRLAAARAQGITDVPVVWADVDDEQAKRILLVDNRANDSAGYDTAELAAVLADTPDLIGTGYTAEDLAGLGVVSPEAAFTEYGAEVADSVPTVQCPDCGHTFPS